MSVEKERERGRGIPGMEGYCGGEVSERDEMLMVGSWESDWESESDGAVGEVDDEAIAAAMREAG